MQIGQRIICKIVRVRRRPLTLVVRGRKHKLMHWHPPNFVAVTHLKGRPGRPSPRRHDALPLSEPRQLFSGVRAKRGICRLTRGEVGRRGRRPRLRLHAIRKRGVARGQLYKQPSRRLGNAPRIGTRVYRAGSHVPLLREEAALARHCAPQRHKRARRRQTRGAIHQFLRIILNSDS
jgi:hypothetical protein